MKGIGINRSRRITIITLRVAIRILRQLAKRGGFSRGVALGSPLGPGAAAIGNEIGL